MDQKTASWFAYVLSIISAVILLVTEKENKIVRQHAWQSLFLGCVVIGIYIVLGIIFAIIAPFSIIGALYFVSPIFAIFSILRWLLGLGWVAISVICILKAIQNEMYKIPVIYNWVEKMK